MSRVVDEEERSMRRLLLCAPAAARRLRDSTAEPPFRSRRSPGYECNAVGDSISSSASPATSELGAAIMRAIAARRAALGAVRR